MAEMLAQAKGGGNEKYGKGSRCLGGGFLRRFLGSSIPTGYLFDVDLSN
ncbi:MAG: hypothetical protein R2940_17290 [Syntrophotaleaceae bacterium]